MKRFTVILLALCLLLCSCGGSAGEYDLDLIVSDIISPAMAYAEAANMNANPKDYLGQTIRAEGCIFAQVDESNGNTYHFIEIADTAGCCSEYLEIELAKGLEYPDEETIMYVYGVWASYEEEGKTFYRIEADKMELSIYETEVIE